MSLMLRALVALLEVWVAGSSMGGIAATAAWKLLPPSLEELERRASHFGERVRVEQAAGAPAPVFILRDFLAPEELQQLLGFFKRERDSGRANSFFASQNNKMTQVIPPPPAKLAAAKLLAMQEVNARLARLVGVPETSVENGIFHGHTQELPTSIAIHLDNNKDPAREGDNVGRLASSVIYLAGTDQGVIGGETVFPLQNFGGDMAVTAVDAETLAKWETLVNSPHENHKPQKKRFGRVCAWDMVMAGVSCGTQKAISCADCPQGSCDGNCRLKKGKCVAKEPSPCRALMRSTKKICEENQTSHLISPRSGDAVLFFHHDGSGNLTMRAIHGACPTTGGYRISLSKFIGYPPPDHEAKSEL